MTAFSISPAGGGNEAVPGNASRGIQFQQEGRDIGRRNTDTVNLRSVNAVLGLLISIGVGEQVNTLTIGNVQPPAPQGLGWNTTNEYQADDWTFSESNYRAELA